MFHLVGAEYQVEFERRRQPNTAIYMLMHVASTPTPSTNNDRLLPVLMLSWR